MKIQYLAPIAFLASGSAFADLGEAGWSGDVSFMASARSHKSNLYSGDDKVKTGQLNSDGDKEDEVVAFPIGSVKYTFGDTNNQQFFINGETRDGVRTGLFSVALGYRVEVGEKSTLAVALIPNVIADEVWRDPYMTNERRHDTDMGDDAVRITYKNILDTNFYAQLTGFSRKIDDEDSGLNSYSAFQDQLEREGDGYYLEAGYVFDLGPQSKFKLGANYNDFDADGEAMSLDGYGVELTYTAVFGNHSLAVSARYRSTENDEMNPIFNQVQEDDRYSAILAYSYDKIEGWDNWSIVASGGTRRTDSNIEFYDETENFAAMGLRYRF
ncbi:DUF2860 family protein [Pseudoalteromonas sp. T1lg75]|uniref:DUF2860 family protein n=1 Tax=Pseudoalteromonas sp. T1lg75 TaxID=2077102 RepID=UPI000CF65937|nr:DUF2860 family protein [Pseudoalteromonas sp. T1lg75]